MRGLQSLVYDHLVRALRGLVYDHWTSITYVDVGGEALNTSVSVDISFVDVGGEALNTSVPVDISTSACSHF